LIPELLGRLPVISPLTQLNTDALIHVLTEPKNALVKQYQHLFSLEGAQLTFTTDGLRALAERALERETGARALRGVIDEVMLDLMYELPEQDNEGAEYILDREAIQKRKPALADIRVQRRESA